MATPDAKLEAIFMLIDENGDGQINVNELQKALAMNGATMTMAEVQVVMRNADTNGNGTLSLSEFKAWMNRTTTTPASTSTPQQGDNELRRMFTVFDENGDGRISTMELWKAMQIIGTGMTFREAEKLMSIADTNRDGMIDFNEFKKLMSDVIASEGQSAPTPAPDANPKLRRIFTIFDEDGDGKINVRELYKGLQMVGINLSLQEVMVLMQAADTNKDGFIDILEFSKIIQINS